MSCSDYRVDDVSNQAAEPGLLPHLVMNAKLITRVCVVERPRTLQPREEQADENVRRQNLGRGDRNRQLQEVRRSP